jgi:ABC-2 type transport system permease protein
MRRMLDVYVTLARVAIIDQLQYRVANYFYMIGMIAEPVIYLVVWSTVAISQGGEVGGYTPGQFAAYYIVWTLVRNMNIVFTPYGWEQRIRQGQLAGDLLKPLHPLHRDVAFFIGWKVVVIIMWLPIAAFLAWVFKPVFQPTALGVAVFCVAIWGAYLIRTMLLSLLGLITFWTTRVSAIFELYFAVELVLSGRLVPMTLMPPWVQTLATYLPFRYAFGFPIEALVGNLPTDQILLGLGMQVLWIVLGIGMVNIVWRFAIRQFTSVGN